MANAVKDNNNVSSVMAVSNADGTTTIPLSADPTNHTLDVVNGTTGSSLTGQNALRDSNYVTTLIAVSSADGSTPVPLYIDPATKQLLIKST